MQRLYSTVNKKGQVTIPLNIRKEMNILSGDELKITSNKKYVLLIPFNKMIDNFIKTAPHLEKDDIDAFEKDISELRNLQNMERINKWD